MSEQSDDPVVGDSDDACAIQVSEKRNVPEVLDKSYEVDSTLVNKYEGNDQDGDEIISTEDNDKTIDTSDDSIQIVSDPLNVECEVSNANDNTADLSKDIKKENPTISEESKIRFARVVFDASDMGKDCKTLRLNAATPMNQIKKIFSKHLDATEDIFMMHFNDREVMSETLLELFGDSLDGDDNVIKIVKSVKVKLGGELFPNSRLYLEKRPNTDFFVIRQNIAAHLKTPPALIGLVYNGKQILNDQTLESVNFSHGGILEAIKKQETKIRLRGPIFDSKEKNYIEIDPNTTMRSIKLIISRHSTEDLRKITLTYKDSQPNDQDTPLTLRMSDTDILFASLKTAVFIRMKGSIGETEEFYKTDKPLGGLLQAYSESRQGKQKRSFKFRFNGNVINDEDTAKSLGMVDGDCIIASEKFNQVFTGSVFPSGFVMVTIDTEMKLIDVKKHFSKQLGKYFKDIVFKIDGSRLKDDDTPQSLNICNGITIISVSIEQYIEVLVTYFCSGPKELTYTSKIRQGIPMEEWKSEVSAELEEPVHHLSFMWKDSEVRDLDTPERIGIQDGDTVEVHNELVIDIRIEGGRQVLGYPIHVDHDFSELLRYCSKKCRIGINSLEFKFGEQIINFSDTPRKIGLLEEGTVEVFINRKNNMITVEFYLENFSLIDVFDQLKEFPLLWDICEADQMFLIKQELSELFGLGIDPAYILLFHNKKQINNDKTLEEIGCANGDKICIDVSFDIKEPSNDEKIVYVYVKRNIKETKSSMGNGFQVDDEEICAFELDTLKKLSVFIRKVQSKISCNSKKDKLFLSFNDSMVNKNDLGKTLNISPKFAINHFQCHAFPNLKEFKKHLEENSQKEYTTDSFDDCSEYSFDTANGVETESNQSGGEKECIQNEGNTELSKNGFQEWIHNKPDKELLLNEGETESIVNEVETESIQKEGEKEDLQNKRDTEIIQNEKETESILNERETDYTQNEGETEITESLKNERETESIQNEGETESMQKEGETESIQNEEETDFGLGNNVENEQGASEMVKGNAEVEMEMDKKRLKKEKRSKKCARASCRNEGRHRCSRCKAVSYCIHECHSEDWPNHKVYCDYVYEANKDYVCEVNEATNDSNKEIENTGGEGGGEEQVD